MVESILANPAETAYAMLVLFGVMAGLDYILSPRLGWQMDVKTTAVGYVAGVVPAVLLASVAGTQVALLVGTVGLVVSLGTILYIGHGEPEEPDWEKYMPEEGDLDGS